VEKVVKETVEVEKVVKETIEVEKLVKETVLVVKEAPTALPAAKEPVKISYLVRNDIGAPMLEWADVTVKEFQEGNPHIAVEMIGVPWGDYNAKLLAMFATGSPPEISANYAAGFATFYRNGAIAPLDALVEARNVDLSVFEQACLDALTREGKLWAMPLAHMPVLMFYNKDLLEEAGAPLPPTDWSDTSWTLERMIEIAETVSKDTDDPSKGQWGVDFSVNQLGVASWIWGKDPFNDRGGPELTAAYQTGVITEAFYLQPEVVAAHKLRRDLAYEYRIAPRPTDTEILAQVIGFILMTGRVGMMNQGGWQFNQFLVVQPSWAWGVAPTPYGPAGKNTTPLFNDSWMLSSGAPQPEAGFEFLTYLTVGKGAEHYARITGFIPANKTLYPIFFDSVMENGGNVGLPREDLENVIIQAFQYGYATPGKTLDRYPEWNEAYGQTTGPIWNNEVTVEEGMQAVQARFEDLIRAG